jgi:hypothetical protein
VCRSVVRRARTAAQTTSVIMALNVWIASAMQTAVKRMSVCAQVQHLRLKSATLFGASGTGRFDLIQQKKMHLLDVHDRRSCTCFVWRDET